MTDTHSREDPKLHTLVFMYSCSYPKAKEPRLEPLMTCFVPALVFCVTGRVAQRIRRLTTNQEIPGSNPGVVAFLLFFNHRPCLLVCVCVCVHVCTCVHVCELFVCGVFFFRLIFAQLELPVVPRDKDVPEVRRPTVLLNAIKVGVCVFVCVCVYTVVSLSQALCVIVQWSTVGREVFNARLVWCW